ncbi:MAB_1171c family putative transporter [Nocardia sp. CA-128927]|uniref:MAB_1171c family putative transporter n=1 Tax=Nocardia sp. CA-128927 TaxID=3239975 RepID=UPI003D96CBB0
MNSAPPLFSAIVVLLGGLVVSGRWLLVNETTADHLINRGLSLDIGSILGYAVAALLGYPDFGQRLFVAIGALSLSSFFGFAALLDGAEPRTSRGRQRRFDTIAGSFGLLVVICAAAEEAGLHLHRIVDWERVAWVVVSLVLAWTGVLLVRACVRELRSGAPARREKLTYSALLVFGVYCVDSVFYGILKLSAGESPGRPGLFAAVGSFIGMGLLCALVAIPLINAIAAWAELDRAGRQCRRLRPLWRDLTAAVPEVVLHSAESARRDSASRRYRMTVEIGDALMHLRQFAPDTESPRAETISAYALRIAEAVELKRRGIPALRRTEQSPSAIHPPAEDRTAELRNLLALSRAWPRAQAAAVHPEVAEHLPGSSSVDRCRIDFPHTESHAKPCAGSRRGIRT